MNIPPLANHGLLPAGVHESTLEIIRAEFATNLHRIALWDGLIQFLKFLHQQDLAYPIFIAGGFITDKSTPTDVDIVHDLTGACGFNQYRGFALFSKYRAAIKDQYQVDYCVNLPGQNDFSSFFQYAGPKMAATWGIDEKQPRGIIRIESRIWLDGLNK